MTAREALEMIRYRYATLDNYIDMLYNAADMDFLDPKVSTDEVKQIMADRVQSMVYIEAEILKCIIDLPNADYREILIARYFCHKRWDDIARHMHYFRRHLYKLHAAAMEALERKYEALQSEKEAAEDAEKTETPV